MSRLLAVALGLLLPLAALAEDIPEAHHIPGVPWTKLAFTAVNFSIFVYLLSRFWPTIRNVMIERRSHVREALEKAARARREAEALRAEMQQRLDKLAGELEGMLQQARADIAAERDQILAAARHTAEAIQRDAERTAENELRQARERLRADVAQHALAIAAKIAPQRLAAADQARFVDDFVREVTR
ncbi:F0F1 ATP synthase subunit B [bacterium]|nr:F0F1 ATP synthase subunit B [bacterium]